MNRCLQCETYLVDKDAREIGYCVDCYNMLISDPNYEEYPMKKTSQLPQTKFRSNVIEIFEPVNPEGEHRVYFRDRNGNEVFCYHEDPQILLDLHQKEDYFMGTYIFTVPDSIIKDLEKRINWPVG